MRIFTGGYTEPILMGSGEMVEGRCKGIACYDFDEQTGKLAYRTVTGDIQNPSYVLADAEGAYLYCVNELKDWNGIDGSTVSAFAIDRETGALQRINQQFTCGADACHLSFSPDKKYLLVSNYSGGSLAVYRIREDHGLEPATCILRHQGPGREPGATGRSPYPSDCDGAGRTARLCVGSGTGRICLLPGGLGKGMAASGEREEHLRYPGTGNETWRFRCKWNTFLCDDRTDL